MRQPSRARKAVVFLAVLVLGFAMFAAPAIFFQMGNAGGYRGANFAILGVVQLVLVTAVVWASPIGPSCWTRCSRRGWRRPR